MPRCDHLPALPIEETQDLFIQAAVPARVAVEMGEIDGLFARHAGTSVKESILPRGGSRLR